MKPSKDTENNKQKKMTPKQIAALVCAVLLAGFCLGGMILVFLNPASFERLFAGWLGGIIALPILLWLLIWSLQMLKKRRDED